VKCQRVIIEVGSGTFALELHPRLTVVAGLSSTERDSLTNELFGAWAGERSGVHLVVRDGANRQLAVVRPRGARHRVVEIATDADVTHEFSVGGEVDLLARAGLSTLEARDRLRVRPSELAIPGHHDPRITELAHIDQKVLWGTAENVFRTERALGAEAEAVTTTLAESEAVEAVELSHRRLELATVRMDRYHKLGTRLGAVTAVSSIPLAIVALPLALIPLGLTATSIGKVAMTKRAVKAAEEAEAEALEAAGAQSYLGFHLQRVNGMLSSATTRKRLTNAADLHRKAITSWRQLVGAHDVGWALEHRDEIMTAALLDRELEQANGPAFASLRTVLGSSLAHSLAGRLSAARRLGPVRESYPLILDDPFRDVDPALKPALLALLGRWAGNPQVIFLTEDPEVVSWARVEQIGAEISLIEAAPTGVTAPVSANHSPVISTSPR